MLALRYFILLYSSFKILKTIILVVDLQLLFHRLYYCKLLLSCIPYCLQHQVLALILVDYLLAFFLLCPALVVIYEKYHIFSI